MALAVRRRISGPYVDVVIIVPKASLGAYYLDWVLQCMVLRVGESLAGQLLRSVS